MLQQQGEHHPSVGKAYILQVLHHIWNKKEVYHDHNKNQVNIKESQYSQSVLGLPLENLHNELNELLKILFSTFPD